MAANMGLIARNVFQMQLVLSTDLRSKLSFRSFTRNRGKYRWQAIDQENEGL
jgi:hypothetical protein